jgi:hypothetical protein
MEVAAGERGYRMKTKVVDPSELTTETLRPEDYIEKVKELVTHKLQITLEVSALQKKPITEVRDAITRALEHSTAAEAIIDALCPLGVQFDGWEIESMKRVDPKDDDWCPGTEDHRHVIDICGPADGDPSIVDVCCKVCGRSGSFAIDPEEVNW